MAEAESSASLLRGSVRVSGGRRPGSPGSLSQPLRLRIRHSLRREHLLPLRDRWLQYLSLWRQRKLPSPRAHPAWGSSGQLEDRDKGLAPAQTSPLPRPQGEMLPEEKLVVRYGSPSERCFSSRIFNQNVWLRSLLEIPKKVS